MEIKLLTQHILTELEDMQASDIKQIDVYGKTSVADLLIICTGRSNRHVKAVAAKVIEKLKHLQCAPISSSGLDTGEWALIDCGDIILHIMMQDIRAFYNIENLWDHNPQSSESFN